MQENMLKKRSLANVLLWIWMVTGLILVAVHVVGWVQINWIISSSYAAIGLLLRPIGDGLAGKEKRE